LTTGRRADHLRCRWRRAGAAHCPRRPLRLGGARQSPLAQTVDARIGM